MVVKKGHRRYTAYVTTYEIRTQAPRAVHTELQAYPEILRELLYQRSIVTEQAARRFLNPRFGHDDHSPFLFTQMDRTIERIEQAIHDKEKITIFADYDHDGIPGAVLLVNFFKVIGYDNIDVYIPHRNEEGFGLRRESVEKIITGGTHLIITVDCGITAVEPVAYANERGVDVIITDHHLASGVMPPAWSMVNPNSEGETYPYKGLCGSGVVFKCIQGFIERMSFEKIGVRRPEEGWEYTLLDLVGIATIGDMVPLSGENRLLVREGLITLRKTTRPGIKALMQATRLNQGHISEDDIAFMITPRINAASRMDTPELAFQLLAADTLTEAESCAVALDQMNTGRKSAVARIVKSVNMRLAKRGNIPNVIVVGDKEWQPGLLGLAANALMEKAGRAVFLWGKGSSQDIRGSCRSHEGIDLVALMSAVPQDTFLEFGGHKNSGGFSTMIEHVHHLEEYLNEAYSSLYREDIPEVSQHIDLVLQLADVNWENYAQIELLGPFGVGNPKPVILFQDVEIGEVKHFGAEKNHLQLLLRREKGVPLSAMSFFTTGDSFEVELKEGNRINLIATMEKSVFRGTPELRLRVVDIIS